MHLDKVLITGATGGLGNYLSKYFVEKGHSLIISSRSNAKLQKLKKDLIDINGEVEYFNCNLLNEKEILELTKISMNSNVKILINNAAITCSGKKLDDLSTKEIHAMLKINLIAPILLSKFFGNSLSDIININSMVGLEHKKYRTLYSSSKWGLRGFSESYKKETKNLNVLDVYPSNIKTVPKRKNAMDAISVVSKIYESFQNKDSHLIIDGRPKK